MRNLHFTFGCLFVLCASVIHAQPGTPEERNLLKALEKKGVAVHDITYGPEKTGLVIDTLISTPQNLEGLDLLRTFKGDLRVHLEFANTKYVNPALESLARLPELKVLSLRVTRLTTEDWKRLQAIKQLEQLWLKYPELSDDESRHLHSMKNLKKLDFQCFGISDKALVELGKALPEPTDFRFWPLPHVLSLPPLVISAEEDLLTKLKKQKFNLRKIQQIIKQNSKTKINKQ